MNSVEKNKDASRNFGLFSEDASLSLLVLGIPNVGKSTIINRFRNIFLNKTGKATVVGNKAGVTRAVLEKIKICDSPKKIYLFDTPGILEPTFHKLENENDLESLMRCAVCANISDEVVGPELIADYMLYWWNKREDYSKYLDYFDAARPTNDIIELLTYGALKYKIFRQINCQETGQQRTIPDFHTLSCKFLMDLRRGKFGPLLLDDENIKTKY